LSPGTCTVPRSVPPAARGKGLVEGVGWLKTEGDGWIGSYGGRCG
jgi:hypothetical protein